MGGCVKTLLVGSERISWTQFLTLSFFRLNCGSC